MVLIKKGGGEMASWRVTEDAVSALKKLSGELAHLCENLNAYYETVYSEYEEQIDGLGKHSASIGELIIEIQTINQDVSKISGKLQIKLNKAAMIREKSINENPYSAGLTSEGSITDGKSSGSTAQGITSASSDSLRSSSTGASESSSAPSVDERTVFELESFLEEMEFSDGDSLIIQCGGAYKEVIKTTTGKQYEAHHIPAKSVFSDNMRELPTIALTKEDHAKTSSFRWRMGHTYKPSIPSNIEVKPHKENVQEKIDQGLLAEAIRDEIYEIRDVFGDKYDGAIKQYIASMIEYIEKNGTPKT